MTWKLQVKLIWIALSEPHYCFKNWSRLVQTCLKLFKLVWNGSNVSDIVHIGLDLSDWLSKSHSIFFLFENNKLTRINLHFVDMCSVSWLTSTVWMLYFSKIILVLYPKFFTATPVLVSWNPVLPVPNQQTCFDPFKLLQEILCLRLW